MFYDTAVTKTVALRKILTERCSYAERVLVKQIVKITSELSEQKPRSVVLNGIPPLPGSISLL